MKGEKMSYKIIKGSFGLCYQGKRHVGSRPDGDSMWFKPDRPELLRGLGGRNADFNGGDFVQLRFEGIDALELHYPGSDHQHLDAAVAARNFLLNKVGFDVEYAPNNKIETSVRSSVPESVRGYILSRNIDPFGRPVAFVFTGSISQQDGNDIFLDTHWMDESLNAKLMQEGHVYPAYYRSRSGTGGLPWDIRERLTALADNAWMHDKNMWFVDKSRSNPRIRNKTELMELAIWPKLYRRLAKYFRANHNSLAGFETWLRADPQRDDNLWIIPREEDGNLHDIFEVHGDHINMLFWPEELIITPR
ncbi:MAG: hypothetical protein ACYS1A_02495 [Planctomycetota bacterium]